MTDPFAQAFTPLRLGGLRLRNRIVKAATFEGMCRGGAPTDALVAHHRAIAAGGAGDDHGRVLLDRRRRAELRDADGDRARASCRRSAALTDAVHREGAAASLQLGHCGYFADRKVIGRAPLGASRVFNTYGLSFARPMTDADIARVIGDFVRATTLAREAGCDAVELHFGHGYLVSQFLSPYTNRRTDRWGGPLENRMRFAVEIVRAVRAAVGAEFPVLAKMNLRDGFPGGLEVDDAVEVARALEREGIGGLVLSGGFVSRTPLYMLRGDVPLRDMLGRPGAPGAEGRALALRQPARAGVSVRGDVLPRGRAPRPRRRAGAARAPRRDQVARGPDARDGRRLRARGHGARAPARRHAAAPPRAGRGRALGLRSRATAASREMDRGGVRCVRSDAPARRALN